MIYLIVQTMQSSNILLQILDLELFLIIGRFIIGTMK